MLGNFLLSHDKVDACFELKRIFLLYRNVAAGQHKEKRTLAASSTSASVEDEVDLSRLSQGPSFDLITLLDRLRSDIGSIALFSGQELEVLTEFEPEELAGKYDIDFLRQIKEAADRHLEEKREIRNALGLLNLYHKSSKISKSQISDHQTNSATSPSKRKRSSKN